MADGDLLGMARTMVANARKMEEEAERAPSAAAVTRMVDETAKSVMRMQGRDPDVWDRLPSDVRDDLRLLALDRLRSLA